MRRTSHSLFYAGRLRVAFLLKLDPRRLAPRTAGVIAFSPAENRFDLAISDKPITYFFIYALRTPRFPRRAIVLNNRVAIHACPRT
jgi:hypothetical protein